MDQGGTRGQGKVGLMKNRKLFFFCGRNARCSAQVAKASGATPLEAALRVEMPRSAKVGLGPGARVRSGAS